MIEGKGTVFPVAGSLKLFSDGSRCRSGSRDDVMLRNTKSWRKRGSACRARGVGFN